MLNPESPAPSRSFTRLRALPFPRSVRHRPPFRHARSIAITTIEVLAVIVIGGLLAVLIFPAFQRIQQNTASIGCVANLKQLAAAHLLYERDHSGRPPPNRFNASHPESEGHNGVGIHLLRRYYRSGPHYTWDSQHRFIPEKMEMCPSVRFSKFSVNLINGPDYDLYSPDSISTKNFSTFYLQPSKRPLIWDGINRGYWSTATPSVPLRHHNGINCAFLDGHIENIKADDPRLYHRWWYYAIVSEQPDPNRLGDGNPMGITELPYGVHPN